MQVALEGLVGVGAQNVAGASGRDGVQDFVPAVFRSHHDHRDRSIAERSFYVKKKLYSIHVPQGGIAKNDIGFFTFKVVDSFGALVKRGDMARLEGFEVLMVPTKMLLAVSNEDHVF